MNHAPLIHSKRSMMLMAIAASCPFAQAATDGYLSTSSAAGTSLVGPTAVYDGSQAGIDAREVARRQAMMNEAMQLLQEGRTAYADEKYKQALEKYQAAWDRLPKAPATRQQQDFIIKSIGDASIAVAIEYSRIGRYDDAEQLLLDVIARDPGNKRARKELALMRDPVRNNPALSPEHVKNVEEVNRLLTLAFGYYDLGKYDEAYAEFNRVIQIDPYNTAARRGQEQVSKRRQQYYRTAHDSYRARALAEVDALWEEPLPQETLDIELDGSSETVQITDEQLRNSENLDKIQITTVNFEDTSMEDALDFLRGEARRAGVLINFRYDKPRAAAPVADAPADDEDAEGDEEAAAPMPVAIPPQEAIISDLKMQNLTAKELLEMMCAQSGCQYRVENKAIVIYQTGSGADRMFVRSWKLSETFFTRDSGAGEEDMGDEEDAFSSGSSAKSNKIDAKTVLKNAGVKFPKGSDAQYSRSTGRLTVTNTPSELDAVEQAIQDYKRQLPQMVKVSAKFVEVSQTNEEELSFDWVVNPFSINDAGSAFLGGVNGAGSTPTRTYEQFVSSGGSAYSNNHTNNGSWPITNSRALGSVSDTVTNGLMTGGLRTGTGALSSDSLSNLVARGSAAASAHAGAAPGILSLSGIYDSGSFQMIMRGLSQKKGVDIMSAPSLVLQPGTDLDYEPDPDPLASDQRGDEGSAKIEVIRRFIYPTAYDPPEIQSGGNSNWGSNNDNNGNWGGGGMPVASPANPSEWGVEEVGIIMRIKTDEIESDNVIKFKRFEIRVVDFEGFINYGSPITAGITTQNQIEHITLTENRIDMPIFSRRYINSNPCIYDGYTIAIGGLIEDNVQKVEDKVPVFGDLPLIGRFFRSNAESHVRKNLTVFVTAEMIDPTGKPTRLRDAGTGETTTASTAPGLFPDDGIATP